MLRAILMMGLFATPIGAQDLTFDFKGITNLDVRNGVTVNVVPGDKPGFVATALSGDASKIKLQKFGAWLAVSRDTRWLIFPYGRRDEIVLNVTLPQLKNIKAFGTATATATGFEGDTLRAEALEGGTVTLQDINADEIALFANEGGQLSIGGTCQVLDAEAAFNAVIAANDLLCETGVALVRTGGTIAAQITESVTVDDSKGGQITVTGGAAPLDPLPEENEG